MNGARFAAGRPLDADADEDEEPTDDMWEAYDKAVEAVGGRIPWNGLHFGAIECIEFGWFSRWEAKLTRHVQCEPEHPDAVPDLNRILHPCGEARWDQKLRRFVKR